MIDSGMATIQQQVTLGEKILDVIVREARVLRFDPESDCQVAIAR